MSTNFLQSATFTEQVFWICAILGTLLFVLKMLLMFFAGIHHDIDGDVYHDVDTPEGTEASFKALSLNSITGFFMMFGWVGLACYRQFKLNAGISTLVGFIAGCLCVVLIAKLFQGAAKLEAPGALFNTEDIIGDVAEVYQQIPAEGAGVIQISRKGRMREISAISEFKKDIESFTKVEVVRAIDGHTVSVKQMN